MTGDAGAVIQVVGRGGEDSGAGDDSVGMERADGVGGIHRQHAHVG